MTTETVNPEPQQVQVNEQQVRAGLLRRLTESIEQVEVLTSALNVALQQISERDKKIADLTPADEPSPEV